MEQAISYSIIIPVFNSTHSLIELTERIGKVFNDLKHSYEIIFVDDASPEKETWITLEKLSRANDNVYCYQLMRNFGKAGAVICGFKHSRGKYIITMDDDLQHFPEDIPKLISLQDHDIVIGYFRKKNHSFFKRFTSDLNSWLETKLIGKPKDVKNGPFKLIHSEVIQAALEVKTPYPYIPALLFYVTKDIVMVEVNHGKRVYNETGFTLKKMLSNFFNLLFNNSSFLLQKIAALGMFISTMSLMMALYFFIKKLTVGTKVQGWASLAVINLFLGGLILFSIGILGEYLIRIINGVENRPPFILRKRAEK